MDDVMEKIREYVTKAKDGAVKLTRSVSDKTNTVVDQAKLRFAIGKTEDKIKEVYAEIGSEVYTSYAAGDGLGNIQEYCEKLDDLHKEAENLREQLNDLIKTVKCSNCGAKNGTDDVYCSKCGEKLNADAETASEEDYVTVDTPEEAED